MTSQRDFPEDFEHENGVYQNRCLGCKTLFLGYKRRVVCKVCEQSADRYDQVADQVRREFRNPLFTSDDMLEIAIGGVIFREKVILNLREQIKNLRELLKDSGVDDIIIDQHQYKHIGN